MKHQAKHSKLWIFGGMLFLGLASWSLYRGINCEPTKCNASRDFWDCGFEILFFLPFSIFCLTRTFWNINWDDRHIYYRTWYGRRVKAPLSSIEDIGFNYFSNDGNLIFEGYPKHRIGSELTNLEQLFDVLKPFLAEKYPYKLYATAYRDIVEKSQNCGCLVCYSIFDKSEIKDWVEYPENDEIEADLGEVLGKEYDIAVCPTCNLHNGVTADQSMTVITVSEMEKCNAEFESNLREDIKTARQELRKTTRQRLGLS